MGCCCCCEEDDMDNESKDNPGPDHKRRCTDILCLCILVVCIAVHVALVVYLDNGRVIKRLIHGRDHYGNFCGLGNMQSKRYVYYPDLETDFRQDNRLRTRYGICIERCPEPGTIVNDYEGTGGQQPRRPEEMRWYVVLPSFKFARRCIPYKPPAKEYVAKFCAYPPCDEIPNNEEPSTSRQVCGIEDDDPPTKTFWLLTKPDATLVNAWRLQPDVTDEVINARISTAEQTAKDSKRHDCKSIAKRTVSMNLQPADDAFLVQALTKYTGILFTWSNIVYQKKHIIIGLGIGGAVLASLVIISALTFLARCIVLCLIVIFFVALVLFDYLLFQQAWNMRSVYHEGQATSDIDDIFVRGQGSDNQHIAVLCKWLGIVLAILIPLLACGVYCFWNNFEKLMALLSTASQTLRQMPSLLLFPFLLVPCMVVTSLFFLLLLLGLSTKNDEDVGPLDGQAVQIIMIWLTILSFLWAYFLHVAVFIAVVAFAVAHWYFYRDDPERNAGTGIYSGNWFFGKPALHALGNVFRYHLGSLAFGSIIMAVVTLPRIIVAFIVKQAGADKNSVVLAITWILTCLHWCLENCLKFLTEYAYIYVAITGVPFCSAARASFSLIAKYPLQVALDRMAGMAIGCLTCVSVPLGMAVISYHMVEERWVPCATFIMALAWVTTRLAVGVYDICITTLFACTMRDSEHYGGRYAPAGLRVVCEMEAREIELMSW